MAAISKITKTSYSGSRAAYYGIPPGMGIQKKEHNKLEGRREKVNG